MQEHSCAHCGAGLAGRDARARYCIDHAYAASRRPLQARAAHAVFRAVKNGTLPRVRSQRCVDCGAQAMAYEHRDYAQPLHVEPVCVRCNRERGPGANAVPRYVGESRGEA